MDAFIEALQQRQALEPRVTIDTTVSTAAASMAARAKALERTLAGRTSTEAQITRARSELLVLAYEACELAKVLG